MTLFSSSLSVICIAAGSSFFVIFVVDVPASSSGARRADKKSTAVRL